MKEIKKTPEPIYPFEAEYPYSYGEDFMSRNILFDGNVLLTWSKLAIVRTNIELLINTLNGAYNFGRMKQYCEDKYVKRVEEQTSDKNVQESPYQQTLW